MSIYLILLIILAVTALSFIIIYNGLVAKRVAGENALSQIEVQLKRRHDLIPNIVETVKGYAGHEKETLERVIQARNSAISAGQSHQVKEQSLAEGALTGALRQVFALSENYPDLKANQNFLQLQEELTSTENRIAFARQHYNDSVALYNASLEQFPSNMVANITGFQAKEYFELDEMEAKAAREVPKVSF